MSAAPTRRVRFGLSSAVLLACATISCALVAVLGSRHHARWDLTAAREHTLSARTRAVLADVADPATIIVSADFSTIDRGAVRRLADLVDEFGRANPKIRSKWIDASAGAAAGEVASLLAGLAEPLKDELDDQRTALERVAADSSAAAAALTGLSDGLKALADAFEAAGDPAGKDAATRARDQAGFIRTIAGALEPAERSVRAAAAHSAAGVAIPAVNRAREAAADPLQRAAQAAAAVAAYAEPLARPGDQGAVARAARDLASAAARARDIAARAADDLSRLKPSDPLIVSHVLEHSNAVLVTSKRGTVAVDFQAIFPAGPIRDDESGAAGGRDPRFAGEALITTAFEGLFGPPAPIVVFVHAQTAALLDERGEPTPPALAAFRTIFDRMRLTRTTPAEWAVASQPLKPDLAALDSAGNRPVVWVVLPAPPRVMGDGRQPQAAADRAARIRQLGAAARTLIDAGEHVLACVEPSDLPSLGEPDPLAQALEPMGVRVDSARPIIRTESSPQGALTWTFHMLSAAETGHPIGRVVDGVRIVLPWATPLTPIESAGVSFSPLLTIPHDARTWGEAQWMLLRDLVGRGLARPLQPLLLAETPTADPARDLVPSEGAGGLIVAAAAERQRSATAASPRGMSAGTPQRMVVVASPEWLSEGYTQASEEVAGRRVRLFPGNLELLDAAVAWLAGRDERIAQGPRAGDVPRIGPIADGPLRALRILLIAGLPGLVLIAGALLRLLRG